MKPTIAAATIAPSATSAQSGFTGNSCATLLRREAMMIHKAPRVAAAANSQDSVSPRVPLIPPKRRKYSFSGPMVWPLVRYQATLRQTRRPPSVTMKAGISM